MAQALALLVLATVCLLVIRILLIARQSWRRMRIAYGANNRIPEDASTEGIPSPPTASAKLQALTDLGFTRLGEARVRIPYRPSGAIAWIFAGPTHTTVAHLAERHVFFNTCFGDRHLEVTSYPTGEHIHTSNMLTDYSEKSVPAAYQAHLARVEQAHRIHGAPTPMTSMLEYITMETMWRRKTGQRILRRQFIWDIAGFAAGTYTLGILLYLTLSTNWRTMSLPTLLPALRLFSLLVTPVIAFIIAHDIHAYNLARKLYTSA